MGDLQRTPPKTGKNYEIKPKHVQVNTIQFQTYVARLSQKKDATKGIYNYGDDNLYPQKVKSIADRSPSTKSAIETAADFVNGDGFLNESLNDIIINKDNETFLDLLRFICSEKKTFKGIAIHVNYNLFGEIAEINGIPFEFVRVASDKDGYYVHPAWEQNYNLFDKKVNEKIFYNKFNPENALNEIAEIGFENYKGQIFYFKEDKKSIYPLCKFDSVLDYSQYEAEASLYQLGNIQNGFSLSGVAKIPLNAKFQDQNDDITNKFKLNAVGGQNAGRFITMQIPPTAGEMKDFKVFENISRNNIDGLFTNQNKNAEVKIYAAFKQPRILNSITDGGMFNDQELQDAYNYYNTVTEIDREEVRKILNKITEFSIWAGNDFEIKKQLWISKTENTDKNKINDEPEIIKENGTFDNN